MTGVQTCALPIFSSAFPLAPSTAPDRAATGQKDRVVCRDPPKRVAVSQLGASVEVKGYPKLVCQPQNGSGEKRLSISIILSAPLPFALPAIIWSSPVGLGLETM